MRILHIGQLYPDSFALHIKEAWEALGHEVISFEPGVKTSWSTNKVIYRVQQVREEFSNILRRMPQYEQKVTKRLLDTSSKDGFDVVFCSYDYLTPLQVKTIKREWNCKVILWFPDAISNFRKAMFLDSDYDFLFFKEPFVVKTLRQEIGSPVFYLPECCNPRYHNRVTLTENDMEFYGCDITTAGNMHTSRASYFRKLGQYNVKIWGNPAPAWMNSEVIGPMIMSKYVVGEEKSKAFLASKIVLNTIYPTEIYGVNARMFEAAGIGAFQLANYRPSVPQLYNRDEMITFETLKDMQDKIEYYLNRPSERLEIAEKGYLRTHRDHTYLKRVELIIETMNGRASGFPMPKLNSED